MKQTIESLAEELKQEGHKVEFYYDQNFNNHSLIVNNIMFRKNIHAMRSLAVESCLEKVTIKNVCKQAELFKKMLNEKIITEDDLDGLGNYQDYILKAKYFVELATEECITEPNPVYLKYILRCFGGKVDNLLTLDELKVAE